jgi:hypothetical protein
MRRALDGGLAAGGGTEQLNCGCLRRLADGLGGGAPSATVACLVLTEVNLPTTRRRVARPLHGRVTAALAESATAERGCGWRRNEDRTTGCGTREMCLSPGGTTPSGRPALILHLHPTRYRCTGDASPSALAPARQRYRSSARDSGGIPCYLAGTSDSGNQIRVILRLIVGGSARMVRRIRGFVLTQTRRMPVPFAGSALPAMP